MALDIPTREFFSLVGHDGSKIIDPQLPDPMARAGIHFQEAIDVAWSLGFAPTPFELFPTAITVPGQEPRVITFPGAKGNWGRFVRHLKEGRGVIECQGRRCGHAVAFENGRIFDPDGSEFDYSREACELRGLMTVRLWRMERRK
jgi:hypothetical protein